jgi:hypothetical protein
MQELGLGIKLNIKHQIRKKKSDSKANTGRSMPQKILSFERQKPEGIEDISKKQTAKSPQGKAPRVRKESVDSFIFNYLTEIDWMELVISAQHRLIDAPIFPVPPLYMRGVTTKGPRRCARH